MGKLNGELILIVVCSLVCTGVLIPAAIILSAIDKIEDHIDDTPSYRTQYYNYNEDKMKFRGFDADSTRVAAVFSLVVSSIGMLTACACRCNFACTKNHYELYTAISFPFHCFISVLILGGGIANFVYSQRILPILTETVCSYEDTSLEICSNLRTIATSGIVCFVFSVVLFCLYVSYLTVVCYNCGHTRINALRSSSMPPPFQGQESTLPSMYLQPITTPGGILPSPPPMKHESIWKQENEQSNAIPAPVSQLIKKIAPPSHLTDVLPPYENDIPFSTVV